MTAEVAEGHKKAVAFGTAAKKTCSTKGCTTYAQTGYIHCYKCGSKIDPKGAEERHQANKAARAVARAGPDIGNDDDAALINAIKSQAVNSFEAAALAEALQQKADYHGVFASRELGVTKADGVPEYVDILRTGGSDIFRNRSANFFGVRLATSTIEAVALLEVLPGIAYLIGNFQADCYNNLSKGCVELPWVGYDCRTTAMWTKFWDVQCRTLPDPASNGPPSMHFIVAFRTMEHTSEKLVTTAVAAGMCKTTTGPVDLAQAGNFADFTAAVYKQKRLGKLDLSTLPKNNEFVDWFVREVNSNPARQRAFAAGHVYISAKGVVRSKLFSRLLYVLFIHIYIYWVTK
jgi:uncharacterized Zn finger protein (UPF0148 family)